ncbi:MAG TPA: secretion system protein E, partial [Opitutae bacterium]|nr:secretion system protein E [Opitutae bacterium]
MNLNSIYSDLSDEQRQEIEALPRSERILQIALLRNLPTRELVKAVAETAGLPVLDEIELVENPTSTLPLRLIHEYQCVPVRKPSDSDEDEVIDEDSPIPLVTLWPPDSKMDRWIYAV